MIDMATAKQRMNEVVSRLDEELTKVRTGRANASLVDSIMVESYGSRMPLKQVASVTVPEATQILITPWDKSLLSTIESAIRDADLGMSPVNDGAGIRLNLPPLSTERREQLVKLVRSVAEEGRVAMRQVRHEAMETVKQDEKAGNATEDDRFRTEKQLNDLIAEMNKQIDERVTTKERELNTV